MVKTARVEMMGASIQQVAVFTSSVIPTVEVSITLNVIRVTTLLGQGRVCFLLKQYAYIVNN